MNRELALRLLAWYDENRRSLPWRGTQDAYRIWVSEIMLQQTRAEAVKDYYVRFLEALPDVAALADVEENRLLKLWEGLGYYSRARNLKRAAQIIMEEHGGVLPADPEALLRLPGVGLYTAGAVASIAYGVRIPAVDGNALRVCQRVMGSRGNIALEAVKRATAARLLEVMPPHRPGEFNQAMMDLGALVCLPGAAAQCAACPLVAGCAAFRQGITAELPVKSPPRRRKLERRVVLILRCGDRLALRKRPAKGLLAGLWELPNALLDAAVPAIPDAAAWQLLAQALTRALGLPQGSILAAEDAGEAKHVFTHIEWHMQGFRLRLAEPLKEPSLVWVTQRELEEAYALPSAFSGFRGELFR
jgi:A/G-specific adenine glycosylase